MAGLNETIRNARLNVIRDAIDAGGSAGVLEIYSGSRPATGGAATTLLGTLTFSDPCAPDASGGELTFNSITEDSSADASGTASWARITDGDGTFVMDMAVGESGSGAQIILNTVTIVEGGPIRVTSGSIVEGNS